MLNSTLTNLTSSDLKNYERVSTSILFGTITSIGIVINITPIILTIFTKLRKNNVNLLVANMSATELLHSIGFTFFQNSYLLYQHRLPPQFCQWLGFINASIGFQAFLFPPFLALNRYISLYHSHIYRRLYTVKRVWLMIAGTWVFVFIVVATFYFGGHTGWDDDNLHCCIIVKGSLAWSIYYWFIIMVPLIGIGNMTMIFCNWNIYKRLTNHQATKSLPKNIVSQHREILYFTFIEMIMPICLHSVYLLAKFIYPNRSQLIWRQAFTCLYLINSSLRSLLILTILKPYRKELKKFIFCERNSEIGTVAPASFAISRIHQMKDF